MVIIASFYLQINNPKPNFLSTCATCNFVIDNWFYLAVYDYLLRYSVTFYRVSEYSWCVFMQDISMMVTWLTGVSMTAAALGHLAIAVLRCSHLLVDYLNTYHDCTPSMERLPWNLEIAIGKKRRIAWLSEKYVQLCAGRINIKRTMFLSTSSSFSS